MNGVGLATVARLLGHHQRETTAIYAHLDDRALHEAAAQPAALIAGAVGFTAAPSAMLEETVHAEKSAGYSVHEHSPDDHLA